MQVGVASCALPAARATVATARPRHRGPAYHSREKRWGGRWGSNPRRPESQSGALPAELRPPLKPNTAPALASPRPPCALHARRRMPRPDGAPGRTRTCNHRLRRPVLYPVELRAQTGIETSRMVGAEGFEPPTLCSQSRCATRLRYAPPSHRKPAGALGRRRPAAPAAEGYGTGNGRVRAVLSQTDFVTGPPAVRKCAPFHPTPRRGASP